VGAVIAIGSEPLASGFNENPNGLKPCIEQFGTCYRDVVRHERFVELSVSDAKCPFCSYPIPNPLAQPWLCPHCGQSLDAAFFPDRAMKWCTALHAEERALINVGNQDLSEATLYTTTFPCMLCAEKIIHAGIHDVVYVEAYPDAHGLILFNEAGVHTHRFEGVRSRNFERYFAGTQPEMEEAGKAKLRAIAGLP
jgi:deoxycytidylate deaminase